MSKTKNEVYVASHLSRGITFIMPDNTRVEIAGLNDHLRGKDKGVLEVGGGAITRINSDQWTYIESAYKNFEPIANGLIYVAKDSKSAKSEMKEKRELRTGFEPIDPEKTNTKEADKK